MSQEVKLNGPKLFFFHGHQPGHSVSLQMGVTAVAMVVITLHCATAATQLGNSSAS